MNPWDKYELSIILYILLLLLLLEVLLHSLTRSLLQRGLPERAQHRVLPVNELLNHHSLLLRELELRNELRECDVCLLHRFALATEPHLFRGTLNLAAVLRARLARNATARAAVVTTARHAKAIAAQLVERQGAVRCGCGCASEGGKERERERERE